MQEINCNSARFSITTTKAAVPCLEIQADPAAAYRYTARGNLCCCDI